MNLRHLYQRRGFWLVWGLLGIFGVLGPIGAVAEGSLGASLVCTYVVFLAGVFVSAMQVEILSKPFSWCLPGHREVPRRFMGCVGGVLSVLSAMLLGAVYHGDVTAKLMVCVSIFFLCTMAYWLGASIVWAFPNWGAAISVSMLVLLVGNFVDIDTIFEYVAVRWWWATAAAGVVVNVAAWRYWGKDGLARRYCGKMWMGAFDVWNKEKMARWGRARTAKAYENAADGGRVERFFLGRISRGSAGGSGRYIWGNLYKVFGAAAVGKNDWMRFFVVIIPVVCFLGYMGAAINMIFIMPGLMVMNMKLHVHSSLLVCGGRRDRFWAGLATAIAIGIHVTGVVAVMGALSVLLEQVMPSFTLRGHEVVYHAADMRLLFVPPVMIPVVLSFGLIFARYPRLMLACGMGVFVLMMQVAMFSRVWSGRMSVETVAFGIDWGIPILLLCCWGIFAGVLGRICTRRCLVH
jgi:hypothetical protein